jgi:plasmid stabilization system protein ParE
MLVWYHEAAQDELLREIAYLELQAPGLGQRFLDEIVRSEKRILEHPRSAREIRPGIRKRMLRTFKYSLLYSTTEKGVLILAVAHHRRRPGYWVGRLP